MVDLADLDAAGHQILTDAVVVVEHEARRHVDVARPRPGRGGAEVVVGAAGPEMVAWSLADVSDRVEVLDPPAVRDELARIGRELVGRYAG